MMAGPARSIGEPPPAYDEAMGNPFAPSNDYDKDDGYFPPAPPMPFVPQPPSMQFARMMPGPCPEYYANGGGGSPLITQPLPGEAGGASLYSSSAAAGFGGPPTNLLCPHCHSQIVTQTVGRAGLLTWLVCGGLALVGSVFYSNRKR